MKNTLLLAEMLDASSYPDMDVVERLEQGFPLVGTIDYG